MPGGRQRSERSRAPPLTRIGVHKAPGRARLHLAAGPISPRVISCTATGARVALVATTALLLGGDHIEIGIDVGPGAWLDIVEIAGTVAYDAGGIASSWTVRARVADGGALIWAAEPFVVAGGANTLRSTVIDLVERAVAYVRETVVLGRTGEAGGAVRSRLTVTRAAPRIPGNERVPTSRRSMSSTRTGLAAWVTVSRDLTAPPASPVRPSTTVSRT